MFQYKLTGVITDTVSIDYDGNSVYVKQLEYKEELGLFDSMDQVKKFIQTNYAKYQSIDTIDFIIERVCDYERSNNSAV